MEGIFYPDDRLCFHPDVWIVFNLMGGWGLPLYGCVFCPRVFLSWCLGDIYPDEWVHFILMRWFVFTLHGWLCIQIWVGAFYPTGGCVWPWWVCGFYPEGWASFTLVSFTMIIVFVLPWWAGFTMMSQWVLLWLIYWFYPDGWVSNTLTSG